MDPQITLLIRSLGHAFDAMAAVAADLNPRKPMERPVTRTQIRHANQLLDLAEQIITIQLEEPYALLP